MSNNSNDPSISIEQCLFGPFGTCPSMERPFDKKNPRRKSKKHPSKKRKACEEEQHKQKDNVESGTTGTTGSTGTTATTATTPHDDIDDTTSFYDSIPSHWAEAAKEDDPPPLHDIDLTLLRRIASQGIADEGSYRGIAWRVLLGYVPCQQVGSEAWKRSIWEQRDTYHAFCKEFFEGPMDSGKDLQSYHCKKLHGNRKLRDNYYHVGRLDGETSSSEEEEENAKDVSNSSSNPQDNDDEELEEEDYEDAEVDQDEEPTEAAEEDDKKYTARELLSQLPPRLKEQWKKSGVVILNAKNSLATTSNDPTNSIASPSSSHSDGASSSSSSSLALGMNQLRVPPNVGDMTEEEFDSFLDNAKLLEEIRKDVVRTHPDLYFFLEPNHNLGLRRYAAIERILFVWSKLNKGVRYVQGMNEIVGTIYYVLANDMNSDWSEMAEPDAYFLFNILMVEMRDVFVPEFDDAESGIQGRIANMAAIISRHDPEVQEHMAECGIDASFYAIRWLTTLLSREFLLPDTIRLWDSMFASTHKENFLRYVCATMVMMVRQDVLKGDFSSCLRLLQKYPSPQNVDWLLESSRALWIYESQITVACHKGGISLHQALKTIPQPPSIIMAFGLRGGGLLPSSSSGNTNRQNGNADDSPLSKATTTSASISTVGNTNTAEDSTTGLLGRAAKRFWSWGASSSNTTPQDTKSAIMASSATTRSTATTEAPSLPLTEDAPQEEVVRVAPKPRHWNRERTGTTDSNLSQEEIVLRTNTSGSMPPSSATSTPHYKTNTTTVVVTPPRSRAWNRAAREKQQQQQSLAPSSSLSPPLSSTPGSKPLARAWNRQGDLPLQPTSTTTTAAEPMPNLPSL